MTLIAPMSCSTSSAAIVSLRMRDSANATSSGTRGFRWWHTMTMSRCSSNVLTVYGFVGFVDDGQAVRLARDADDVRGVTATRTLGVVGVDRPPVDG